MMVRISGLVFLLALCFSVFGEDLLYVSNPVGMRFGLIESGGKSDAEYTLSVRKEAGLEIHRLLNKEDRETRRWEYRFSRNGILVETSEFREGAPVSVKHYDTAGRIRDEIVYQDGEEDGRFMYRWAADRPLAVLFKRPESKSGYRDEYRYLPSGIFFGVVRTYEDGKVFRSLFTYSGGLPREEWHSWNDRESSFAYDRRGNVVLQEVRQDGAVKERTTFAYRGEPTFLLEEKKTRDLAADTETVLNYDERGHSSVETFFEAGVQISVTRFSYQENLLIRKERKRRDGRDSWEYLYDPEENLIGEKVFLNGKEKLSIEYPADDESTSIESHYKDGQIILKVYYKDSKEVKAEFIRDGSVVRTIETGN